MPAPTQQDYDAQARKVTLAYAAFVASFDVLDVIAQGMRDAGTPPGGFDQMGLRFPASGAHPQTVEIFRDKVNRGLVTIDEVHALLPGLLN